MEVPRVRRHRHAGPRPGEGRDLHLRAARRVGARAENVSPGASREPCPVAAPAIGRKRRSNWNYPLAFGTDPSQGDDALPTYYASGVQVDKDAYEDAFVVAQADWLDASGQDQDESEDTSEPDESEDSEEDAAEDEEEDAGEGGDESEDTSEPDESEDTSDRISCIVNP